MIDKEVKDKVTKLVLQYPIEFGEEIITELNFRRLKAKDIKNVPAGGQSFGDLFKLVAVSTNLGPIELDQLDSEDAIAAVEIVNGFFVSGRKTGEAG